MNICLVGYGAIAECHAKALRDIKNVHFRWLVGRRPEPTQAFATEWGFDQQTLKLDEALSDKDVDAVVITSPNALHAPQATAALQAGKHVLLEIPIAQTVDDAQQLAALAERVDRKLMVCHSMRFFPSLQHIRRLVEAEQFHMVQFIGHIFIRRRTDITAAGKPRSWTDNILWHHGAHLIDLAMWLGNCSEVQRVSYHLGPDYKQQGTMDMTFTMTLANGAVATVAQSYFTPTWKWCGLIIGHEQTFFWDRGALYDFERNPVVPEHSTLDLSLQDNEFVDAVRQNREPAVTPATIMPTMRAIGEAQAIADAKKPLAAPYAPEE